MVYNLYIHIPDNRVIDLNIHIAEVLYVPRLLVMVYNLLYIHIPDNRVIYLSTHITLGAVRYLRLLVRVYNLYIHIPDNRVIDLSIHIAEVLYLPRLLVMVHNLYIHIPDNRVIDLSIHIAEVLYATSVYWRWSTFTRNRTSPYLRNKHISTNHKFFISLGKPQKKDLPPPPRA